MVREEILLWDEALKDGVWSVEDVPADEKMENLLSDPKKALEVIFGNTANVYNYPDILWKNHIFSQMVVVAEVCMQLKSETMKGRVKNRSRMVRNTGKSVWKVKTFCCIFIEVDMVAFTEKNMISLGSKFYGFFFEGLPIYMFMFSPFIKFWTIFREP